MYVATICGPARFGAQNVGHQCRAFIRTPSWPAEDLPIEQKLQFAVLEANPSNNYTGTTTVTNGTLQFNSISNLSSKSALGAPTTSANGTIAVAGTLIYTGDGDTSNRIINVTGDSQLFNSGSGLLTLTSAVTSSNNSAFSIRGDSDINLTGGITIGSGILGKTEDGTFTLFTNTNTLRSVQPRQGRFQTRRRRGDCFDRSSDHGSKRIFRQ